MTNKKNRFFTLVFSCCPGAGEMYMGLYQQGISLMSAFFGIAAVAFWLNWEEMLFVLPVIWCYSFFHTHNLRRMTEEEFQQVEDQFFFADYVKQKPDLEQMKKHYRLFGAVLLILALSMFWKTGMDIVGCYYDIPGFLWCFGNDLPQIGAAILILYTAFRMMKVKKGEEIEIVPEEMEEETAAE